MHQFQKREVTDWIILSLLAPCLRVQTLTHLKTASMVASASIRIERKEEKFWGDCDTIPGQCDVSAETAKVGSTTIYDYRKLSGNSE